MYTVCNVVGDLRKFNNTDLHFSTSISFKYGGSVCFTTYHLEACHLKLSPAYQLPRAVMEPYLKSLKLTVMNHTKP